MISLLKPRASIVNCTNLRFAINVTSFGLTCLSWSTTIRPMGVYASHSTFIYDWANPGKQKRVPAYLAAVIFLQLQSGRIPMNMRTPVYKYIYTQCDCNSYALLTIKSQSENCFKFCNNYTKLILCLKFMPKLIANLCLN